MEIITTQVLTRERIAKQDALEALLAAAREYTSSREACPIGDWNRRIEDAGWKLAQAVREHDKL